MKIHSDLLSLDVYGILAYKKGYGLMYSFPVAADSEDEAKKIAASFIGDPSLTMDIRAKKKRTQSPIYVKVAS